MTPQDPGSMVGQIRLTVDHFNRQASADALRRHGRPDQSTRFEMHRIDHLGSQVRTGGELVNPWEGVRLPLVLAWKFDSRGKLARIEAYPSGSETTTPIAATRKPSRRRFVKQGSRDLSEEIAHA